VPRVGSFPLRNQWCVKGFEGRNFEIHPRLYNREYNETFYFQKVSVERKPRLKATLCYLHKPYVTKFERYHKTFYVMFNVN